MRDFNSSQRLREAYVHADDFEGMMPPNELDMLSDQGIGSGSYVMKGENRRSSLARSKDESSIGLTSLTQLPRENTSPININDKGHKQHNRHIFSDEMVEVDF